MCCARFPRPLYIISTEPFLWMMLPTATFCVRRPRGKMAADRCWTHGEGLLTSMSSQAEASGPNSGASSRRQGPVPTILALPTLLEGRNPYVSNIMPWRLTVEARRCGDANAAAIVAAGRLVRCAVAAARGAVRVRLQPRLLRTHVEPAQAWVILIRQTRF